MNSQRVRHLNTCSSRPGSIVYWMSRDQRAGDNWALVFAQELAAKQSVPLAVVFCLAPHFGQATIRQYSFMMKGLQQVSSRLSNLGIPFFLLTGDPADKLPAFLTSCDAGSLVTDFDPLRIKNEWKSAVVTRLDIPAYEVDAHNIVPCWLASDRREFAARTFRPRISRLLPLFMDTFPDLTDQQICWGGETPENDWREAEDSLDVDRTVGEITWLESGEHSGQAVLETFIREKLADYPSKRNDPSLDGQSNLSPYLHFGQISAQRVAASIDDSAPGAPEFLEELVVRRELSDNFCYYNSEYDSINAFPDWARKTLEDHRNDPRPVTYTLAELETCETHDPLWNAAQKEMVIRGKMHGYMRMYWAKKILQWSESPQEAVASCIYLNDRYEIDGRDPNGYVGIAWSVGGVHDRPWGDRPIFGKIRYMSYEGCKRKFNVDDYIRRVDGLAS